MDREEEPIGRHLPLRAAPGACERWVEVDDEAALVALVRASRAEKRTIRVLPPFSDALPPEAGLNGVVLRLGAGFERVEAAAHGLYVGASAPLALVGRRPGFEALSRAPGTLGDAVEEGWLAPMIVRQRRFRGRSIEDVEAAEPDPKAIVVGAWLAPAKLPWAPRAGQAFLPIKRRDLAELLRAQGLAGLRLGGAALGEDDPRVLVNRGDATPRQIRLLLQAARERVQVATGIELVERLLPPGRGGR